MRSRRSTVAALLALVPSLLVATTAPALAAPPTFAKAFSPDRIGPGSHSTLAFTITATDETSTAVAFTDNLPAGVTIADPASATMDGCGAEANGRPSNPSLAAPDGGATITFSGGAIVAGTSCTIEVGVTAATPGSYINTTGDLTSSAGNSGTATDTLTVDAALPGFSKSFAPSTLDLGAESTLTFTIDNSANPDPVPNLDFTDDLPTGMVIADPANASTDCGTAAIPPTLTAVSGSSQVVLDANGVTSFPAVADGAICTVTVDVSVTASGSLDNVSGNLLADSPTNSAPAEAGFATATLNVATPGVLHLDKDFTTDPAPPGASTTLVLSVTNRSRDFAATDVAFTDDLTSALAGLTFASLTSNSCGGTVTGVGTTTIELSGGSLASGGATCSVVAALDIPAGATPGAYTNTTGTVTGTLDGSPVTGNAATADLFVSPIPVLTIEFTDDPVASGGDVTLQHTLTNTSTTSGLTDGTFLHQIVPPLPYPASVTLPADGFCGPGSTMVLFDTNTDQQALRVSGSSLATAGGPGDSCTFDVVISIPDAFPGSTYTFTTDAPSGTVDGETRTGRPASDDLVVVGAPRLTKEFTDDPAQAGGPVTLNFTIENPGEASSALTDIAFTDDLEATLTGLTATTVDANTCGGAVDIATDPSNIAFTGGSLAPGGNCAISVTLAIPAGAVPGTYTNTTSSITATSQGLATTGDPATDDLIVSGLALTKEFTDDPGIPGGQVTLQFTIDNTVGAGDATSIFFSDNFDTMLDGAVATFPANPCGGSTIGSGSGTLFFFGGSVSAGTSCSFDATVLIPAAAAADTYGNTTSTVNYNDGGAAATAPPATDRLVVVNGLALTKEFTDDPVSGGEDVTLEFVITNETASAATDIAFEDNLETALTGLTATSIVANDCGPAAVDIVTNPSLIKVSGGSLAGSATCTIVLTLAVPASASGTHTNTTSTITGTIDTVTVTGPAASDDLEVSTTRFSKAFDATTPAGDTAVLTFTIENLDAAQALTRVGFTDDLEAVLTGLVAVAPLPADPCGAGSSLTGTSSLALTSGEVAASGSCTFDVTVQVPADAAAGTYPNTTSDLSASGLTVAPPATADLVVSQDADLRVAVAPTSSVIPEGAGMTSTFTVTNDGPSTAVDVTLTIDLTGSPTLDATPAGCTLAVATLTCDVGDLAPAGTADVVVATTHPTPGSDGLSGLVDATTPDTNALNDTASASVSVQPLPTFTLTDSPDPVAAGETLTLTATIDNSGSTLAATDLAFTVDLDAALAGLAATNTPVTDACGTGSTLSGTATVTFADGVLAAGATCTMTIEALVPPTAVAGAFTTTTSSLTGTAGAKAFDAGTASESTTVDRKADLRTAIAPLDPSVTPGGTVTSTVTVTNEGPSSVVGQVQLAIGGNGTFVADPAGCTPGGTGLLCDLGTMAPGASVDVIVQTQHPTVGTDPLTATASGDATDPDAGNDAATSNIRVQNPPPPPPPAPASADLSMALTPATQTIEAGGEATTTATVANAGPSSTSATVTFTLTGNGTYGPAPSGCTVSGTDLACDLGTLASGASATVNVVTTHPDAGSATLAAAVSGSATDTDNTNDQASSEITVSAPPADDLADDCRATPSSYPEDVNPDGPHGRAIGCLLALDVIQGFEDGTFRGTLRVSRGQFASLLVRAIDHLGLDLPTDVPDAFDDDTGSPHEAAANRLAAAKILLGTGGRTFAGGLPISRSQVAAVLVRAVDQLTSVEVPPREDQFDDDNGTALEATNDAAAQLGMISGVAERQFRGGLPTSRSQVTSVVARFLVLVGGPVS